MFIVTYAIPMQYYMIRFRPIYKFKVGKSEHGNFMYTGFQLKQDSQGVSLDQSEYIDGIIIPEIDPTRLRQTNSDMTFDELSLLRKMTGQLNWTV